MQETHNMHTRQRDTFFCHLCDGDVEFQNMTIVDKVQITPLVSTWPILTIKYLPNIGIRGRPADTFYWSAMDRYGKKSPISMVQFDVACIPGFIVSSKDSSYCEPCSAGEYNLPSLTDQVWIAYICKSCLDNKLTSISC